MKRFIALLMSLCITAGLCSLGFECVQASDDEIPFIFVVGYGTTLYRDNEDGTRETIYGGEFDTGIVTEYINEYKDVLIKAIITQNWSDFDDAVYTIMDDLYGDIKLNNQGYPDDGSYAYQKNEWQVRADYSRNTKNPYDYNFYYDWRLDPYDIVPQLREYVELVQRVTGKKEYAIAGRCEGASILLAYMDAYKDPNLKKAIFYASASKGCTPITECLSGELYVDAQAVERFLYDMKFDLDVDVLGMFTLTDELLRQIVQTLTDMYGLDVACWAINNVYEQICGDILPRTMMNTFGSLPGFWSMVAPEKYKKAKTFIFAGKEDEYADFIKKIDTYHYIVAVRQEEIIMQAQNRGTEVYDIVKYGKPHLPLTADADALSDRMAKVEDASFGATVKDVNTSFSQAELDKIEAAGNLSYVSPEKNIDASTGYLKDTTWYIDNITHGDFEYHAADELIFSIVDNPGFDIHTDPEFPQYLYCDREKDVLLIPDQNSGSGMSTVEIWKETTDTTARKWKPFFKVFYKIFTFILKLFTLPART